AVELQDSFHYFMQSKSSAWNDDSWNIFANWPTKDVIDPLELHADNVGVLARYQIENSRPVYLPVDVYQNGGRIPEHPYAFIRMVDGYRSTPMRFISLPVRTFSRWTYL